MTHHVRHMQCLVWLALASFAVVLLDSRPARSMEIPVLARASGASTQAQLPFTLEATFGPAGQAGARPLDLVPVNGVPLTYAERDSIVRLAMSLVGSPYVLGAASPERGFDCSGLVAYVLAQVHMSLPRRAYEQARVGDAVERGELRPGDLLTFGSDRVSHVGIYIGEGRFIHASSVAHRVVVSRLDRPRSALIRPLHGGRRLLVMANGSRALGG